MKSVAMLRRVCDVAIAVVSAARGIALRLIILYCVLTAQNSAEKHTKEVSKMHARILRQTDDVREQVAALARIVFPVYAPYETWWLDVCTALGVPVAGEEGFLPREATLSQLYAIQAALMAELQKMAEQTEAFL